MSRGRTHRVLREELRESLKAKAIEAGLYAANMPAEVGGAGLDTLSWVLYEKELGRANYALHWNCVGRPSNILMACTGEQRERYLLPSRARREVRLPGHDRARRRLRHPQHEDVRRCAAAPISSSTAPSTSSATPMWPTSSFCSPPRARRKRRAARRSSSPPSWSTRGLRGFTVRDGYRNVSHRGYNNSILEFDDCRVPASAGARRNSQGLRRRQ